MGTRRVAILLIACFILSIFPACSASDEPSMQPESGVPTSRIYNEGEFVIRYAKGSLEMIGFSLTESPFEKYAVFKGTDIPNPSSIEGFSLVLPYNYEASLQASSRYFATCLKAGFTIKEFKQDSQCMESTLYKGDTTLRVVVFETRLKIYAEGLEKEGWR